MDIQRNIERFENLVSSTERPGRERLLEYCRKSDFYTAPASTRFHLSCEGGLLQHSLNVYDAMMALGTLDPTDENYIFFSVTRQCFVRTKKESVIVSALFHDLCKTNFYGVEYRNQKVYKPGGSKRDSGGAYDWERVPAYCVEDKNPYGHGEKSVMMVEQFMRLTMEERYAIRWHMGMSEEHNIQTYSQAIEKYPFILFLHTADQMASHFMENKDGNRPEFDAPPETMEEGGKPAADYADEPVFQEATPI